VLVTYSKASPKQHIAAWLDLVALVASDPASDWRSVVVRRTEAGDADALVLVARGETTDGRRSLARDALEVAVDCYRRGLREPVPLFACLSAKLHDGTAKADDWQTRNGFGEGQDEANRLVFGDLDFKGLRALPARRDDPPGTSPFRAQRFAEYLWDAIDESTEALT
jgi:exodeoxyribonuclease V gamma subunit